jgi:lysozyme family protein
VKENYKAFVDRMIRLYEGGYGWDISDPGGPTKYGITCYDLAQHRHMRMDSKSRWAPLVHAMPLSEAEDIYASKYATACQFDALKSGCDCVVMDFGVNSGPSRAVKYAQLVTRVHMDGVLGPETLAAINVMAADHFIDALCNARLGFLHALNTWTTFGRGWTHRVNDLRVYSHGVARAANEVPAASASAKALHLEDIQNDLAD